MFCHKFTFQARLAVCYQTGGDNLVIYCGHSSRGKTLCPQTDIMQRTGRSVAPSGKTKVYLPSGASMERSQRDYSNPAFFVVCDPMVWIKWVMKTVQGA